MSKASSQRSDRNDEWLFDPAAVVREAMDEIYIIDARTGRFLYANDLALEHTGYALEELRLMTQLDLQKDVDVETLTKRIAPLQRGEQDAVTLETAFHRKNGTTYVVEHRVQLLRSQDPPVFVVRAREISERRLPAGALVEDPDLYRRMVEEGDEGIWVIDSDLKTTYANDALARMLGYSREEMQGKPIFDFMDEEWKAIAAANLERRRTGERQQLEFKYIRKDGGELWTIIASHPLFDDERAFTGAYAVVTDITKRKLRELTLMERLHLTDAEGGTAAPDTEAADVALWMPNVAGLRSTLVAKRFALLADPKRLELIELLASGEEHSVNNLASALTMSQSNVSKHLRVLTEAGLLRRRPSGTKTFYSLSDPTVAILCRIVCQWLGSQAQAEYQALAS